MKPNNSFFLKELASFLAQAIADRNFLGICLAAGMLRFDQIPTLAHESIHGEGGSTYSLTDGAIILDLVLR